jgi:hypothetical protein
MRLLAGFIALGLFAVAAPLRAADEPEKLVQELLKTLENVETKLKKIDGKGAATKALTEIKDFAKQIDQLRERSEKLKIDPKQEQELLNQYKDKLFELGARIGKEMTRLEGVDGAKEVIEEMKKMAEKMGLPTEEPKEKKK